MVASPERYSPRRDEARAFVRRRYVLDQMLEKSFITQDLHDLAQLSKVRLAPASDGESELAPEVVVVRQESCWTTWPGSRPVTAAS